MNICLLQKLISFVCLWFYCIGGGPSVFLKKHRKKGLDIEFSLKGKTEYTTNAGTKTIIGARTKTILSDFAGIISSFKKFYEIMN